VAGDPESSRRSRSKRDRKDIGSTLEKLRGDLRLALRHDPPALNQGVNQLDTFAECVQAGSVEIESVDAGVQRLRTLLRRSLGGMPGEMTRVLNVIELLKDQLIGFSKDHG
jgi:hypothetical protein